MVRLTETNLDDVTLIRISGNLMAGDLSAIEGRLNALASEPGIRAVVDLSGTNAMTTPAITLLLRTSREISRRGGTFVLAQLPLAIARMFQCCRLDAVFDVALSVDEAIEIVRNHTAATSSYAVRRPT